MAGLSAQGFKTIQLFVGWHSRLMVETHMHPKTSPAGVTKGLPAKKRIR